MAKTTSAPTDPSFLDTLAGESAFFRAICDARPVGIHREFHMMTVAVQVKKMTGHHVSIDELWDKFRRCYDTKILESYEKPGFDSIGSSSSSSSDEDEDDGEKVDDEDEEMENAGGGGNNTDDMDVDGSKSRTRAQKKRSRTKPLRARDPPRPGDDLLHHPFFRAEFSLPVGNGWPPPPPPPPSSSAPGEASTGGGGHSRKDSVATTTTRGRASRGRAAAAASADPAPTRSGTKGTRAKTTAPAAMSINESDSELTSEGGEKDVSADGEDAEGEDVEGNEEKEEVEAEAEEGGGTRRSARTRGAATKEANSVAKTANVTKKKRGHERSSDAGESRGQPDTYYDA